MTEAQKCLYYIAENMRMDKSISKEGYGYFQQAIKALEQEPRWVPVSERLPDKLQDVLITFYDAEGEYDVAYIRKTFNETYKAHGSENEWVSSMGETTYADYEVPAWMPIEPYKAESEVQDADSN